MDNRPTKQEADVSEQRKRNLLTFKEFFAIARRRKLAAKKEERNAKLKKCVILKVVEINS